MGNKKFLEGDEYAYIEQLKKLSKDEIIERGYRVINRRRIIVPLFTFLLIVLLIGSFLTGFMISYDTFYKPMEKSKDGWVDSAGRVGEYICGLTNEEYFNMQVYPEEEETMIYCSNHNIMIRPNGGKRN